MSGKIGKRFFGPAQLANASAVLYTVPASRRSTIRHIHFSNPTGGAVTVTMGIGADSAATRFLDGYSIPAGSTYDFYCKIDVETTEVIRGHASAATSINCIIDGDEEIFA